MLSLACRARGAADMIKAIGTRLRAAREGTSLSRGGLAKALGLTPEYISRLESGKRTPSLETLNRLATYLGKEVAFFFQEKGPPFAELIGRSGLEESARKGLRKFRRYCERYLQLEAATDRRLDPAPLYAGASAERLAEEERRRLGLGNEPIRDIFSLCELNGLRIFRCPLAETANVSGIFLFFEDENAAFALVNAAEAPGRQAVAAAHEYAHYLRDRRDGPIVDNPDVLTDEYVSLYPPREQAAQAFASFFLTPPSKIREILEKEGRLRRTSYEDVLFLKRYFGVDTASMLRALKGAGLLRKEKFEDFFGRDAGVRERRVFGAGSGEGRRGRGGARAVESDRFKLLAGEAVRAALAGGIPEATKEER